MSSQSWAASTTGVQVEKEQWLIWALGAQAVKHSQESLYSESVTGWGTSSWSEQLLKVLSQVEIL